MGRQFGQKKVDLKKPTTWVMVRNERCGRVESDTIDDCVHSKLSTTLSHLNRCDSLNVL